MQPCPELDVRTIPALRRHPKILDAFDALEPGGAFVLLNDHLPRPLLGQLQAERAGRFDWNVLEAGPVRYRVEIRRRTTDAPRTVGELLETDHRRLDAMVPEVLDAAAAGEWAAASARFAELRCGLERHIDIEEQVLFPVFEEATGITRGPTVVMRGEHVTIRAAMTSIAQALADHDGQGVDDGFQDLERTLRPHNFKEERVLYPTTDHVVGDDAARAALVARMQAF